MNSIVSLKVQEDNLEVNFEISPQNHLSDKICRELDSNIDFSDIEFSLNQNKTKLDNIDKTISRFTNKADNIDYALAISSGILSGIIDILFVGEFSLDRGVKWGKDQIDSFVVSVAKSRGFEGDKLDGAVRFLEKIYPIPADSATNIFGGGATHHLKDFSHHPTPVGLIFSLLTQFTGKVYGTNTSGAFIVVDVPNIELIGSSIPSKITIGVIDWIFHMVSDMAGSSGSITYGKYGTGLPGPFVSLLKELSSLPFFSHEENTKNFSYWVSKLFNGTLLAERDENNKILPESVIKFDLRAEIGVAFELGRQTIPVIVNECVVRICYFVKQILKEFRIKSPNTLNDIIKTIDWENTLPFKNKTITRLVTISSATFFTLDVVDASIRAAIKSGGNPAIFASALLLRINFVESGRLVLAITDEINMELKEVKIRNEKLMLLNNIISLHNAKLSYYIAGEWIMIRDVMVAVNELEKYVTDNLHDSLMQLNEINMSTNNIAKNIYRLSGSKEDINNILKY